MLEIVKETEPPIPASAKVLSGAQWVELNKIWETLDNAWVHADIGEYAYAKSELNHALEDLGWIIETVSGQLPG